MLNKTALFLLVVTVALLASPGLTPPVAAATALVVDDDGVQCPSRTHSTIGTALAAANDNDTIQVCEGEYTEASLVVHSADDYLTITGPGATPENDGVATVHHGGVSSALFTIQADDVVLQGLDLDATPPGGFGADTGGIEIAGNRVEVGRNEIHGATSTAVSASGGTSDVRVLNNNIHDSQEAVVCFFSNGCTVAGNTINVTDRAVDIVGSGGNVTNNVITHGYVRASGDNHFISTNQISGPSPSYFLMSVNGSSIAITDNTFSDSAGYGLQVEPGAAGTDVTIARNTFTRLETPIFLYDSTPGDAAMVVATIGGSPGEGNTFVDSAGNPGDFNYLLHVAGPTLPVDAEYNNWGLCTAAEIEQEIYHQVDEPTFGLVDFEPFIEPDDCPEPATPTPTATPAPTPTTTPGATATPTPGTRTVTILPGSWANFAWTGDSSPQTVADCFGAGNIAVMYRLDTASGSFQRWVRGRDDLSNMGEVFRYDALLALNGSGLPATCTMPDQLSSYTVTIPAGRWANFAWTGGGVSAAEAAGCFGADSIAVMYRLDAATQTFQRWVRGREDVSNMTDVQTFDALLALDGSAAPATCQMGS
jgi:hypothetical protein